ncbi:MAG: hypothetical protein ACRCTD_15700 [Beijerinckiaceae bacterium]
MLPPLPSYAKPVVLPDPREREDPVVVAGREREGRMENGRRLQALADHYETVRKAHQDTE